MKLFSIIVTAFLICSCVSVPPKKPFTVDLRAPRNQIAKIDAYFDKFFSIGGINKDDITVYYYPADDAVGMEFNIQLAESCLFLDESGREAFISALERYKGEYEQRTLVTKGKKTREMYGSVEGFLAWKKTRISIQAYGNLKVFFGYQFKESIRENVKENAAFFTVTQMESNYEDSMSRSRNQTSPITMIYFTRAQAERLAALFNQQYLNSLGFPGRTSGAGGMDKY
jgi:hypothetical protein